MSEDVGAEPNDENAGISQPSRSHEHHGAKIQPSMGSPLGPLAAGNLAAVGLSITMPPDAGSALAQANPEKVLALATQVDAHAFEVAQIREKNRHVEATQLQQVAHVEELAEIEDRNKSRFFVVFVVLTAVVVLVILLAFAAYTNSIDRVSDWLESAGLFLTGMMAGAGAQMKFGNSQR